MLALLRCVPKRKNAQSENKVDVLIIKIWRYESNGFTQETFLCHQIDAFSEAVKNLTGNTKKFPKEIRANLGRWRKFEMSTRGISPPRVFTYFGGNLIFKAKTLSLL